MKTAMPTELTSDIASGQSPGSVFLRWKMTAMKKSTSSIMKNVAIIAYFCEHERLPSG